MLGPGTPQTVGTLPASFTVPRRLDLSLKLTTHLRQADQHSRQKGSHFLSNTQQTRVMALTE